MDQSIHDPSLAICLAERLDWPAFSYILWYNGPTEVYDEKILRMTPIHYCMVGLLAFIILAISSRLMGGTIANFCDSVDPFGVIYLFLHQLKQVELDELEQIQYVNHQAENGLASLLDKMPVGCD